jgi:hypothetical protein
MKVQILYQSKEEIIGKHLKSKQWIMYSGTLTIFNRTINSVVLNLKSEIYDTFMSEIMEESKKFQGNSVTEVYAKLSYWFSKNGILFQN